MNREGRKPDRHMIDGREMTVDEIADMLGVTKHALYLRHSRLGVSYQTLANMYRTNQFGSYHDRAGRYLIEGRWMSRAQIAEMLDVKPASISTWRWKTGGTMEEAVEHFRQWNQGGRVRNPGGAGGRPPRLYRVGSKDWSAPEVARAFGVTPYAVRSALARRDGDMGAVLRDYRERERRRRKQAEDEIMKILMGE